MAAGGAKSSDVQKEEDRLQAIVLAGAWVGSHAAVDRSIAWTCVWVWDRLHD